jgi:hypothetical protein
MEKLKDPIINTVTSVAESVPHVLQLPRSLNALEICHYLLASSKHTRRFALASGEVKAVLKFVSLERPAINEDLKARFAQAESFCQERAQGGPSIELIYSPIMSKLDHGAALITV